MAFYLGFNTSVSFFIRLAGTLRHAATSKEIKAKLTEKKQMLRKLDLGSIKRVY